MAPTPNSLQNTMGASTFSTGSKEDTTDGGCIALSPPSSVPLDACCGSYTPPASHALVVAAVTQAWRPGVTW